MLPNTSPTASKSASAHAEGYQAADNVLITACSDSIEVTRQAGAAEGAVVQFVNDGFSYPANGSIARVTITQN